MVWHPKMDEYMDSLDAYLDEISERLWVKVVKAFNVLGLLRAQRPMPTAALAQALRRMAADELTGVYEGLDLWALTDEGAR